MKNNLHGRGVIAAKMQDVYHYFTSVVGVKTADESTFGLPDTLRKRLEMFETAVSYFSDAWSMAYDDGLITDSLNSDEVRENKICNPVQNETQMKEDAQYFLAATIKLAAKIGIDAFTGNSLELDRRNIVFQSLRNQFAKKIEAVVFRDGTSADTVAYYEDWLRGGREAQLEAFLLDLANNIAEGLGGDK